MSAGSRAINYAFIIGGGILGFVVGLVIYRRTMARAAELALEEGEGPGPAGGAAGEEDDENGTEFADAPSEEGRLMQDIDMMDPDAAALAMDDDDISLWETDGIDGGAAYRDSWDEEAAADKKTSG